MSKHDQLLQRTKALRTNEDVFRCPVCAASMKFREHSIALVCENHHSFDAARQGYIHLLPGRTKAKYDKLLFESRKAMNDSGFFRPMVDDIIEGITEWSRGFGRITLLDAGCGEGSLLTAVGRTLGGRPGGCQCVGLDIAKEGIVMAAKSDVETVWCVGDLAQAPLAARRFDVILNVLSPSNYTEFDRLLAEEGLVLKVVPGSGYLKELRDLFYRNTGKKTYSNDNTTELFGRHFELVDRRQILYQHKVSPALMKHLALMTPLTWGAPEETLEQILRSEEDTDITVDLSILYGKRRSN